MIRTGGGTFDPAEENIYFIASGTSRLTLVEDFYPYLLIAVNEIEGDSSLECIQRWTSDPNKRVFLDSGVFNLSTQHAKRHGTSMDVALSTAPQDIDGFSDLFDRYVSLVRTYSDRLWGYIEIDQGGRENKIKTRTRLESMGLKPIPVYHPINDGWDYFDYLAERYDRICLGNIVQANQYMRLRLISTLWERHRKYPKLWIHVLGLTPNQWLNALPLNSGDSSSWLHPIRWTVYPATCDNVNFSKMGRGYRYLLQRYGGEIDGEDGSIKAIRLCSYKSRMDMLTWRLHMKNLHDLGIESYPPVLEESI
jgi:hypothetical protein